MDFIRNLYPLHPYKLVDSLWTSQGYIATIIILNSRATPTDKQDR